ncbi:MAG: T6SS immunity protein Tdi1 domain-containing protein [Ekhidna sp.]
MENIIEAINKNWSWSKVEAKRIVQVNQFGNIIFENSKNEYYRICPEELKVELIANSNESFATLLNNPVFLADWEMKVLVSDSISKLGALDENEVFCLKLPGVLGGEYSLDNVGKIILWELISLSGQIAFQTKDLPDGTEFKISVK